MPDFAAARTITATTRKILSTTCAILAFQVFQANKVEHLPDGSRVKKFYTLTI